VLANDPAAHGLHDVCPAEPVKKPAAHGVHGSCPVALNDPAGQSWASEEVGCAATTTLAIKIKKKGRK
jgi:hypothetical protein